MSHRNLAFLIPGDLKRD